MTAWWRIFGFLLTVLCMCIAAALSLHDRNDWGWFMFAGLLFGVITLVGE